MAFNLLQPYVTEPWLTFSRQITCYLLDRRLHARSIQLDYVPEPNSLLYVAASVRPYHISGYTTRTHEILRALCGTGVPVHVHTRPGYPWDRSDRLCDATSDETVVEGIHYGHAAMPANNRPVLLYAFQGAKTVASLAKQHRAAVIHAASNHVNALPALLAARQLGIPFQYEMRGLWELTRISRQPDFEGSQAYQQGLALEGLVARSANRLYVISEQLSQYVQKNWGVLPERIRLLPNCVDPGKFLGGDLTQVEPNTIGYAGSLIGYEGLDTLLEAAANLVNQGKVIQVRIAGDGEARSGLEALAQRLGLGEQVQFLGRLLPDEAKKMIARCTLVCIPRKPYRVCEIVPPIKLVEALAMGKPVIVPDLPVFRDEMGSEPPGWFFRSGDAQDLARVINEALARPDDLRQLGRQARDYAITQRNWQQFIVPMVKSLPRS
jgi:glycosyltransferase involved in cell wall biosynthesis